MSQRNDPSTENDAERLRDLGRRLRERESAQTKGPGRHAQVGALGAAWRMSVELVVALAVGGLLGLGLDRLFGVAPWLMIVGLMFGFAAGVRNTVRAAHAMQVPPTGSDLPADDDEDEDDRV